MDELLLRRLRELAVVGTGACVSIVDPFAPDQPLVWVNAAFEKATGYSRDFAIGHNCRFLQGADTDPSHVRLLREAITERRGTTITLLNYRRDGSSFWNRLRIDPLWDADGRLLAFVGVQMDVSDQIVAEQHLDAAIDAQHTAEADTERANIEAAAARRRMTAVSEMAAELVPTLDLDEILDGLARATVPRLADWVAVALFDGPDDRPTRLSLRSAEGDTPALRALGDRLAADLTAASGTSQVAATGGPMLVEGFDAWSSGVRSSETVRLVAELGLASALYVPLLGRNGVIGSIAFVARSAERRFQAGDVALAAELGRRVGLVVENARLFEREHRAAESLQRSMLPTLPPVKDIEVDARYLPADRHAAVGGDFYEVLPLPDGTVAVAVGDVVGHDLAAAAAMGQLRTLFRTVVWTSAEDHLLSPADVLTRVDRLLGSLIAGPLATMFYGVLTRDAAQGTWVLEYSSAGHPEPLVRLPEGEVLRLDAEPGLLLGTGYEEERHTAAIRLPPGSILLAFTDGLVERPAEDLSVGYQRVIGPLRAADGITPLLEQLMDTVANDRLDDTVLLALKLGDP